MFFSNKDLQKLEKFNKDKSVTERENARHLLREMAYYARSSVCRHRQLLHYFGEYLEKDYGYCDNTRRKREEFEAMDKIMLVLRTIQQIGEQFEIDHIIRVVRGEPDQYVSSYGHDKLDVYGKGGMEESADYWESVVRQGMIMRFIERDPENILLLKLTNKGTAFIDNPFSVRMWKDLDYDNFEMDEEDDNSPVMAVKSFDKNLFDMLKKLRKEVAKKMALPPFVVFQDPSLEEMATTYPTTEQELMQVNGVGMGKVKKFGRPFLELIKKYVEENDITTASEVVVKSKANKSKTKIYIIQQIDRQVDLEEISESKGISFTEVLDEIEHICYSGTKLNLDYYIEQIMDMDRQDEVMDYFMQAETDSIQEALEKLGPEDFTEDELRLMRIKFLSQVAL
jgi:ATP-dependent DNA helicase RecQ